MSVLYNNGIMSIITGFTNACDLGRWDTANADLATRDLWLKLPKYCFLNTRLFVSCDSYSNVQWLINRNVQTSATKVQWRLSSIQTGPSPLTAELAADRVFAFSTKSNLRHLEIIISDLDVTKLEVYDGIFRSDFIRALCLPAGMPALHTFQVAGMAYISPDEFYLIVSCCPNLARLDVWLSSGRALEHLKHCKHLQTLCLHSFMCEANLGMQHLANNCRKLKHLRISDSTVTDAGLDVLGTAPQELL